ncbi:MAG: hypothetical protein LBT94_06415 [Prevotellaceae bacterium]|jgi:hypothetical protein|nr:hypothetical protein [Prevotellaceae bacterium]
MTRRKKISVIFIGIGVICIALMATAWVTKETKWYVSLSGSACVQCGLSRVSFGKEQSKTTVTVHVRSATGVSLLLRQDDCNGKAIAEISVPAGEQWAEVSAALESAPAGRHHLFITHSGDGSAEIDDIRVE